jgi:hypothetical protein
MSSPPNYLSFHTRVTRQMQTLARKLSKILMTFDELREVAGIKKNTTKKTIREHNVSRQFQFENK